MILAFGCSVTHGIDVVHPYVSEENIALSYPGLISKYLKVECSSWAFPGNSNENIFHEAVENIPNSPHITAVIIGWTSPVREVWKCDDRLWQFIPSWCATMKDVTAPMTHFFNPPVNSERDPRLCSDEQEYLTIMPNIYELLMKYKFDQKEYIKKRSNYISVIRNYCKSQNIKLIETCWSDDVEGVNINMSNFGPWLSELRHPNKLEHELIAQDVIKQYKL